MVCMCDLWKGQILVHKCYAREKCDLQLAYDVQFHLSNQSIYYSLKYFNVHFIYQLLFWIPMLGVACIYMLPSFCYIFQLQSLTGHVQVQVRILTTFVLLSSILIEYSHPVGMWYRKELWAPQRYVNQWVYSACVIGVGKFKAPVLQKGRACMRVLIGLPPLWNRCNQLGLPHLWNLALHELQRLRV